MQRPLVSIVIATYKSRHEHLSVAIRSALAQSWREIEVIVSDDSPDDALRTLVAGFADARLRYRHNVPALGVAQNHWLSFSESQGDFVAVLNHDDWLAPTFVRRLGEALLKHPQAVLAFCDHWVIDADGRRLEAETAANSARWERAGLAEGMHRPFLHLVGKQTIPIAMGTLMRRSALPSRPPPDAGPAYDLWLSYLLGRSGGGAWYVRDRLSAWRTHDANLTSVGGLDWLQGAAACWQAMADDAQCVAVHRVARRKAALGHYGCAVRSWAMGRRLDCVRHAWRSVRAAVTLKGLVACLLPMLPVRFAPSHWVGRQGAR